MGETQAESLRDPSWRSEQGEKHGEGEDQTDETHGGPNAERGETGVRGGRCAQASALRITIAVSRAPSLRR